MAIKKYIVNLPDYIEEDEKTGNLAFNGVDMHPIPYEESIGKYKETLEFLKVATKEELMSVYGFSSLDSLFGSESVETIVNDFKAAVDNRKRVRELIDDIGIFALQTIVDELYGKQYKSAQVLDGVKSESD